MKSIVVKTFQWAAAFLAGFLLVVILSNERGQPPEKRMLEQGYGITGLITSVDANNSRLTIKTFDPTADTPLNAPIHISLQVREDSVLQTQDFILNDGTVVGIEPAREISLNELRNDAMVFIHFSDTASGFVVKELLTGQPVPVFNAVTPLLAEAQTMTQSKLESTEVVEVVQPQ